MNLNSYQLTPADFPGVVVTDEFRRYPTLVKPSGEQVCLTCNGRGTITDYRTEDGWSSFPQTLACPDCDGGPRLVTVSILNPDGERIDRTELADGDRWDLVEAAWKKLMAAPFPGIESHKRTNWGQAYHLATGFVVVVESDWHVGQALMGV